MLHETLKMLSDRFGSRIFLSIRQVSEATGIAEQTFRNLISQATQKPGHSAIPPTRKIGGRRFVHIGELADWLDQQCANPDRAAGLNPVDESNPSNPKPINTNEKSNLVDKSSGVRRKRGRPTKVAERRFREAGNE